MDTNSNTPRIKESSTTSAESGTIRWAPQKSIWYISHSLIAVVGGYLTFSWSALLVFFLFTGFTLCLGHSLGMHRRLIHNSYECPLWMEYFFVHLGTLVGMAGPFGMLHQHDLRDWAQRKKECHSYLRHGNGFFHDGWWQLHCDLHLDNPPEFQPESRIKDDAVYKLMENTWMLQQLPWAFAFFLIGGISWVVWGISARIAVSITGHWLIGYFAHNSGHRDWHVENAAVQGHNVPFAGILTMGESWHNNHHAFPGSAMLGVYEGQADPGWWVLNALGNLGLVWSVRLPRDLPNRAELYPLRNSGSRMLDMKLPKSCKVIGFIG